MLANVFEPERVPPFENRAYIIERVVAAKTEFGAAKLYAGLVRLKADSERLPADIAEYETTRFLVSMSSSIAKLTNEDRANSKQPRRPLYSSEKADFNTIAKDIELRFSPANTIYREAKPLLGL